MNYYSHHIGDFNNATRHLTRVERSVYRDALEHYYDTESALTGDIEKLSRRLLCVSDEEKMALDAVLEEFFELIDGEYHHDRCDLEIEKYRANSTAKARAGKASAEARRKKSYSKKQENQTGVEHVLNDCSTEREQNPTNQEPITNNQEPINNNTCPSPSDERDLSVVGKSKAPPCPTQEIVDLFNKKLPTLPAVSKLTDSRKQLVASRWRQDPEHQSIQFWETFFDYISESPFLMGQTPKPFKCNFDWIFKQANFVKIYEGNYHGKSAA